MSQNVFVIKNQNDRSKTLEAAVELANNFFWTALNQDLILEYNAVNCTIEDIVTERKNLNPHQPLHIPEIEIKSKICKIDEKTFYVKFIPSEPQDISVNKTLIDLCKRTNEQIPGYKRLVLFTAISILHEFAHLKHMNFKELRGSRSIYEPRNFNDQPEAGDHYEMKLQGGVMELELHTFNLKLKSNILDVLIEPPEAKNRIDLLKRVDETPKSTGSKSSKSSREADEFKEESSAKNSRTTEPSEKKQLVEVPISLECTCLQNEGKYILDATMTNNTEQGGIKLPERLDDFLLNVVIGNKNDHIKPKDYCKCTRLIENLEFMGKKLIHVPFGQSISYSLDLTSLFHLRNGVFWLESQLDIQNSRQHFVSNKIKIPILVQLATNEDVEDETISLDLSPDFLAYTKFKVSNCSKTSIF